MTLQETFSYRCTGESTIGSTCTREESVKDTTHRTGGWQKADWHWNPQPRQGNPPATCIGLLSKRLPASLRRPTHRPSIPRILQGCRPTMFLDLWSYSRWRFDGLPRCLGKDRWVSQKAPTKAERHEEILRDEVWRKHLKVHLDCGSIFCIDFTHASCITFPKCSEYVPLNLLDGMGCKRNIIKYPLRFVGS